MNPSRCILTALAPLLAAAAAEPAPVAPAAAPPAMVTMRAERPLVGDVRLLIASAPGLGTIRGVAVDDDGRSGVLISPEIVLRHRLHEGFGYLLGVGLFASAHSIRDDPSDGTYAYYAAGMQASLGLTLRIKAGWHAELRALGQLGRGRLVFTPEDDDADDTRGSVGRYHALGGLGALVYTLPLGIELSGHAGWQDFVGRSDFAGLATSSEGRGAILGIAIGYVF